MAKEIFKATTGDVVYAGAKAILGSVPLVGAAASEMLGLIVTPPLEKRREVWMQDVGERLKQLEEEDNIDLAALSANEQFIDIVLQATALALKTSQKDKLIAFKNIIANTAKGDAPDDTRSHIFLSLVDSFTEWHLRILHLFDNPKAWYQAHDKKPPSLMMGSLSSLVIDAFPKLRGEDEIVDLIWDDLKRAGLHRTGSIKTTMSGDGILSNRTTDLGKDFITFIST